MTLKIDKKTLDLMEEKYPGIGELIHQFEDARLSICTRCQSDDTAEVGVGLVGCSINIAAATTKFKLVPNGPKPGKYFCNTCGVFFS